MKILILSTFECNGGAAIAANRLMQALNKSGQDAKMLVRDNQTCDPNVVSINTSWLKRKINFLKFAYERLVIFIYNRFSKKNLFAVSIANTGTDISRHPLVKQSDIIHLHWINQGFLSLKNIEKLILTGKPIVWTMHDMWVFTGVCHYAGNCEKYKSKCEECVLLKHFPKSIFRTKYEIFKNIKFVGCSCWIADCAKNSFILKNNFITNASNPIDIDRFNQIHKPSARQRFSLPTDKNLILFAAAKLSDTRKGIFYFTQACKELDKNIEIVFLGGKIEKNLVNLFSLKTHQLGYLQTQEDILAVYSACDIFVIPSLEDNLPNTIMEAMSCGTPCVGFHIGGIPEMIDHKQTGYIAEYKNADDLAKGIIYCVENREILSKNARQKVVENYSEKIVAEQYMELYKNLLKTDK